MRAALALCLTAFAAVAATAADPPPVRQGPKVVPATSVGVGRLVPDAAFTDITGKAGKLSDFRSAKLLVVAFTNTTCPLSKKYATTWTTLEPELAAKGVAVLFVNPTAADEPGMPPFAGRYVHDKAGTLTAALGATSTTEVVVLDAARTVQYRGAVDDQYGLGYSLDAPRQRYLLPAVDALLAGNRPAVAATTAPGCPLDPPAASVAATPVTYHARVERIIQANCVECHRAGGVGPFVLDSFDAVVSHKATIKRVVEAGTMPPWFAAPPAAGHPTPWANDRRLTPDDKRDLLAWLAGDRPKGDPADAPAPRTYPSGWLIGKPDAMFPIPQPINVKADGVMPYQNVTVETTFAEDKWVQALEVQPTARQVVHHVLVHVLPKGAVRPPGVGRLRAGADDGRDEAQGFFAIYVPGNGVLQYPDGFAKKLPKGSTLRFQIHYTPNGTATTDQTRVGFVFAKEPPVHEVRVVGIVNPKIRIPAGAADHREDARVPVPFDAVVMGFAPHMHVRGKAARYEVKLPDGTARTLLDVPAYDFNWQLLYKLADPVAVPRGSTLTFTAWYDNSTGNPANPDPTKEVTWGPQTYDEMHLGYVEFYLPGPGRKK